MNTGQALAVVVIVVLSLALINQVLDLNLPILTPPINSGADEWVVFQPKQCQEIPWRKIWAEENSKLYGAFPLENELGYIKDYYARRKITILESRLVYQTQPVACNECGCPEEFSFVLNVSQEDAAVLLASGFGRVSDNPTLFQQIFGPTK